MKIKFIIITTFIILFLYVLRLPVLADSVGDWSGLQARFTVGDPAITVSQDIVNDSGGTVILNSLSTTAVDIDLHFVSGNDLTGIFRNTGTLSAINGILKDGKASSTGGAIYNSGNLTIKGITFTGNNATTNGGAIYTTAAAITNISNNSIFGGTGVGDGNTAVNGGAIYSNGTTNITGGKFLGNGINSVGTTITTSGGAIYNTGTGNMNISGGVEFKSNKATTNGGAIHSAGTMTIGISGTISSGGNFEDNHAGNSGGAIYDSSGLMTINEATFNKNGTALDSNGVPIFGTSGGAVYNKSSTNLTINDSDFTTNISASGGAIYGSGVTTTKINNCTFGGATIAYGNTAVTGGAIYNLGKTIISGGSFSYNGSNASVTTTRGGAIYNDGALLELDNGVNFSNNKATNGGAIYSAGDSKIGNVGSGGTFLNNQASVSGGAIYNTSGLMTIKNATFGTSVATGNTAGTSGGAIYTSYPAALNIYTSSFTGNSATTGGAIYKTEAASFTLNDSSFELNSAITRGGAIYANGATTITNNTFTNNSAGVAGGAICNNANDLTTSASTTSSSTSSTISDATFNQNNATSSTSAGASPVSTYGGAISNEATSKATDGGNSSATTSVTISTTPSFSENKSTASTTGASSDAKAYGGAFANTATATSTSTGTTNASTTATISNANFSDNEARATATGASSTANAYGGAISNVATATTLGTASSTATLQHNTYTDNIAYAIGSSAASYGGAIYSGATATGSGTATASITDTNSTYTRNSATYGGAIYNKGTATITNGTFSGNSATTNGGAIYNEGVLKVLADGATSLLSGNTANGASNALYNAGTTYLNAGNGGIITFNDAITSDLKTRAVNVNSTAGSATLTNGTVNFNNDISKATFNIASGTTNVGKSSVPNVNLDNVALNITGGTQNFINSTFKNGSRIYLNDASPSASESTNFTNSTFNGYSYTGSGAAIYNAKGAINISPTNISGYTSSVNGGAIYNAGTMVFDGGTYDNNTALNGGAVYNAATGTATFTNTTFTGNRATADGGAIYNLGTLYLKADGGQTILTGNSSAGGVRNGLYNHGTVYLNGTNGGSIVFNDTVNSSGITTSIIRINDSLNGAPLTDGTVYFNNNITNSTINLYNGMIVINNETFVSGNNLGIYDGLINTQNNHIGTMEYVNAEFEGISNWLMDVDLANKTGDAITTTGTTVLGTLNISDIILLSDATSVNTAVPVSDEHTKGHLSTSVSSISTALFNYTVSYDSAGGTLNFVQASVAPGAVTADVAQTQAFLLQTAIDRQFFANMESFMSFPLAQRESTICCALMNGQATGGACPISGNGTFSPIYTCALNRGIWVKDFVSFENIPLRNGPNVSTVEYGTLIGMDAPLTYLKRGWVGNTSAFVGYLGSNQNYDSVGVSQNGVLVGLAENLVKGNNFLTLMASVGASMGIANTPYGNDYFNSLFAGAAVKGGHNFEFKNGDYIIQPNLMLAYTFTHTPDYTTASGLDMTSQPLNAMQIAPGLRIIKNLKEEKGQVYLVANFVYNVMDNTRFTANDVQLPQLSIAPYFEYGIGYQRVWENRLTGFFQTLLRGGGRNGIAIQFGLRWAF